MSVGRTGGTFQEERVFLPGSSAHRAGSFSTGVCSDVRLLQRTQLSQGSGIGLPRGAQVPQRRAPTASKSSSVFIPGIPGGWHQPATSPSSPLGCFFFFFWSASDEHLMKSFFQHPRRQISRKFYWSGTTATSLPLSGPGLCLVRQDFDLSLGTSPLGALSHRIGCTSFLYLLFSVFLEFSLLLSR